LSALLPSLEQALSQALLSDSSTAVYSLPKIVLCSFAQRNGQTRSVERNRRHPDQGEDNPNRKGVAGNGRV
jgi:hypothetical protein